MQSNILGAAVVGLGVGEQHARAYAAHSRCRLRCLLDLDKERAQRLASEFQDCGVAVDFKSLLARPDIDIVSIASFDDAHYQQVTQALSAQKHVFVEKPLCRTETELADIRRLLDAADGRLHLSSNLVLRGAPLYRWLRQEIAAGRFGDIYAFDGDYLYGRLQKITGGWRKDTDHYSVMLGGGIHLVDLLLWLTGQRPAAVTAVGNRISTQATLFRYHDFVAATLRFESGMIARITANFGCVHRHQHVMRIFGTRQSFILDDAGPRLFTSREPTVPAERLDLSPLPDGKGVLIPNFVETIAKGLPDDELGRRAVFDGISVVAACDRALQSGVSERIEYL